MLSFRRERDPHGLVLLERCGRGKASRAGEGRGGRGGPVESKESRRVCRGRSCRLQAAAMPEVRISRHLIREIRKATLLRDGRAGCASACKTRRLEMPILRT